LAPTVFETEQRLGKDLNVRNVAEYFYRNVNYSAIKLDGKKTANS